MREDIAFASGGGTLRGWLYRPTGRPRPAPGIVVSHGFSAVKEQGLAAFAEWFRTAGFVVLVFDYRHLGSSDGADRGRIIPQEQHDDLRAAVTYLSSVDGVDPERIGVWGTSYSGGHALFVGALDPRIRCIVAQAPAISVARSLIALAGEEGFRGYLGLFAQDHAARQSGAPSGRLPIVAPDEGPAVLATPDAFAWFTGTAAAAGGRWVNSTSIESVARMAEYLPAAFIDLAAPKPLLIIAGESDALIPIAQVRDAFERAGEPKQLVSLPCGHFDFYPGEPFHEVAASSAEGWFVRWLQP